MIGLCGESVRILGYGNADIRGLREISSWTVFAYFSKWGQKTEWNQNTRNEFLFVRSAGLVFTKNAFSSNFSARNVINISYQFLLKTNRWGKPAGMWIRLMQNAITHALVVNKKITAWQKDRNRRTHVFSAGKHSAVLPGCQRFWQISHG